MRFHGITMVGPFVNQKLSALPTFVANRDQGRLVWLTDGTLWYGSDIEWVSFASGVGDANEAEDMYSDLLRTTIFLNASYDEFAEPAVDNVLVASSTMEYDSKNKWYEFTNNEVITSTNLFDDDVLGNAIPAGELNQSWDMVDMEYIDYVLVSVDYIDTGTPTIEVTSNGGVNWFEVTNNRVFRIPTANAGTDLRLRFTAGGTGTLKSWGVLYNKDLTAACTKYGLTYARFESIEGQTTFEVNYISGAVQVFLNGDLLDDSDFDASSGTEIVFVEPLHEGDIVYVVSYSTSILESQDIINQITQIVNSTTANWELIDENTQVNTLDRFFVDTSTIPITATAPPNPEPNDFFVLSDYAGTFNMNNCTIDRNGSLIMGESENLILNVDYTTVQLVYFDSTQGWKVVSIST